MRLRALEDIFVVARKYTKGEEFNALTFDGIPRECVEVVSGEPAADAVRRVGAVRRTPPPASPQAAAAAAASVDPEAAARLNAMLE